MNSFPTLARERCFHHAGREAVSRCTGCGRSYCRECVTDHEGKLRCVSCLAVETPGGASKHGRKWMLVLALAGFLTAWGFFYGLGYLLLKWPTGFDTWDSG